MAFPVSLPSNTDPTALNKLNSPSHSQLHQSHNAEIVAVETKVGTGSSTPTSGKVLRATGTGTSSWSQVDPSTDITSLTSATLRGLISDETGTGVAVFGTAPTISSPALTTPTVATSINDTNGNEIIKTPATASAVNEVTITNAATTTSPSISATGEDTNIDLKFIGKGTGKSYPDSITEWAFDFIVSGLVWSGDSYGSTLAASMTAGFAYISGVRVTIAAVTARAFTASKDTYIDLSNAGAITYTEVSNNAASPALSANNIRIGIIVSGAGSIVAIGSVNQGQENKVLPIASSVAYSVTDSLGNLICPRDPNRKLIGYRQNITDQTGISADTMLTGVNNVPFLATSGRKIRVTAQANPLKGGTSGSNTLTVRAGVTTASASVALCNTNTVNGTRFSLLVDGIVTPVAGLNTYGMSYASGGSASDIDGSVQTTYLRVEQE